MGNAFPRPPGAKKKSGQVSVTKRRRVEVSALRRGVVEVFYLMALIFMDDDLLERAARRRATTASSLQLHAVPHRHPLMHRSGSARGRHGLGRAVTCHSAGGMLLSKHPQRLAAGSIPTQADARQGLLHGRALLPSQGLEEVRRASCHCILLPRLQLCLARLCSRPSSLTVWCCSLFMHSRRCQHFASQSSGTQERLKRRKFKSGL